MYDFLQKANDQSDLTGLMPALTKIVLKIEEINTYIDNIKDKRASVELMEFQSKCQQIIQKHLPDLITHYCALTPTYRVKTTVSVLKSVEGERKLTTRDLLVQNLAKMLEEVEIIEKGINENQLNDFMTRSHIIDEAFGVKPKVHLSGDEPIQKIQLESEFDGQTDENESQELIMQMINQIPKKTPEEKRQEQLDNFKKHFLQKKDTIIKEPVSETIAPSEKKVVVESALVKKEDPVIPIKDTPAIATIQNIQNPPQKYEHVVQQPQSQSSSGGLMSVVLAMAVAPIFIWVMSSAISSLTHSDDSSPSQPVVQQVVATAPQQTNSNPQYVASDDELQVYGDKIAKFMDATQAYVHERYHGDYSQQALNNDDLSSVRSKISISDMGLNSGRLIASANGKKFQVVLDGVNEKTCTQAMKELNGLANDHHYHVDGACMLDAHNGNTIILSSD
jgi:hypothetical protein